MPPGGDGIYYFSAYFLVDQGEYARLDMRFNDVIICSTYPDHSDGDYPSGSCSAVVDVVAGDEYSII